MCTCGPKTKKEQLSVRINDAGNWHEFFQKKMRSDPNSLYWSGWSYMEGYYSDLYQKLKKEYANIGANDEIL